MTSFDSVDGILRLDLFEPSSNEDWNHCVKKVCKFNFIKNLVYAKMILNRYENPVLVGVEIELERGYLSKNQLLGYDIIDGNYDVSLITNWGTDEEGLMNPYRIPIFYPTD